jgi:hypothetical protein
MFSAEKIVATLAHVLETHHLAPATRDEGLKIICAYNYFCPTRPVGWPDIADSTPESHLLPSLIKNREEHQTSYGFIRHNSVEPSDRFASLTIS